MAHQHEHDSAENGTDHDHEDEKWMKMEQLYKEKSNEDETIKKWLTESVDDYSNLSIPRTKFSIVSFGCGDGTKDLISLRAILGKLKPGSEIVYHGVDPDENSIKKFETAVKEDNENASPNLKQVHFNFLVQTYENFVDQKKGDAIAQGKADLILFNDSFCHIPTKPADVLKHCYENELSSSGSILIVLWNDEDFWFKIRRKFLEANPADAPREGDEGNDYLTVQEVKEVVEKFNWRFKMLTYDYTLDVSECFKPESDDGKRLMECVACYANVPEAAVESNASKLLELIQEEARFEGSARILDGKHGIIVIHK